MKCNRPALSVGILFLAVLSLPAQTAVQESVTVRTDSLPVIKQLDSKDILFTQYCQDVENAYMIMAKGDSPEQFFYAYKASPDDTLFTIAARCSVPYETIATLNTISDISVHLSGRTLILPTAAGVFVADTPINSIEILLKKKHLQILEEHSNIWYTLHNRLFCFLENERFSSTERAFFLDTSLQMPLAHSWLSSSYGMRISPISGKWKFHSGIDLAAPEGTSVYACKGGTVSVCGYNDTVFGNYIILRHSNSMTSIYAHLSRILIKKGDTVSAGMEIGKVGMTGEATGPHLHFEIRVNNVSTDPQKLLQGMRK